MDLSKKQDRVAQCSTATDATAIICRFSSGNLAVATRLGGEGGGVFDAEAWEGGDVEATGSASLSFAILAGLRCV